MSRPRKYRKICSIPLQNEFGPIIKDFQEEEVIVMTLDEYEAIRLIDFEGLDQQGCAEHMMVARTTVQKIYNEARKKLAIVIVEGHMLRIEGGDYRLCEDALKASACSNCRRRLRFGEKNNY
jgi:predicted DNA-binding protein (UPF0251 family)